MSNLKNIDAYKESDKAGVTIREWFLLGRKIEDVQDDPIFSNDQKKMLIITGNLVHGKIAENIDDLNNGDVDQFFDNMKRRVFNIKKGGGKTVAC